MKNHPTFIRALTLLTLLSSALMAQPLVVTSNQTPQQLVQNLIGNGVNATNITGQIATIGAAVFINNGVTGFSLSSGIILSSGQVTNGLNGSASNFTSTDLGTAGDPDLDAIVAPRLTEDAQILDFDFTAASDSVEFYFVFASEEYNDYANTNFNDVFAFMVTGPGYTPNTNVALVPVTITPISINTVNNGNATGPATGPCMNCAYYVDNVGSNVVGMIYDGYTTVIRINFPVWPCSNYHFKIGIADAGDGVFDSAVMLQENSFVACPNMQGTQHAMPVNDTLSICFGGSATLTAPEGATYSWSTGETTRSIIVTQPGTYDFTIMDPSQSSCFAFSDAITVIQQGVIQTPAIIQNGNLLSAPTLVPSPGITYQWNMNDDPIPGAVLNTLLVTINACYTLTIYEGSCESTSNIICVTNTSIYEIAQSSLHIFPNPVTGTAVIETPFDVSSTTILQLFDITGREAQSPSQQQGKSLTFNKGVLPSGVYFLKISNTEYQGSIMKKIIVE